MVEWCLMVWCEGLLWHSVLYGAWCLVWLMVAWCLVSWMAALMVGGGVGTNVMAHGDNVSVVMWCVGGECMCYGVYAYPTAI